MKPSAPNVPASFQPAARSTDAEAVGSTQDDGSIEFGDVDVLGLAASELPPVEPSAAGSAGRLSSRPAITATTAIARAAAPIPIARPLPDRSDSATLFSPLDHCPTEPKRTRFGLRSACGPNCLTAGAG